MFGWCTWDAFYSSVDGPGIERGVDTLRAAGSPPLLVIIDDGWQVRCSLLSM
jgi:raffinose synthase